jgi:SAM-dependent methyltransferase
MNRSDADVYLCPNCRGRLTLAEASTTDSNGEISEGKLSCGKCGATHPIVRSIARFVPPQSYADSFGFQWNQYAKKQIGGNQKDVSKNRWDILTHWRGDYSGQKMLEAGCGAGRFSEVALDTGVELWSIDLSRAVDAARENVAPALRHRHHICQASLYEIPLPHGIFDKVYCMGVLQHTPDVKKSFMSLVPFIKPGGEFAIDCYHKDPIWNVLNPFRLKYWVRPFFCWWPPTVLHAFLAFSMSLLYDCKRLVNSIPLAGPTLAKLIPIGPLRHLNGEFTIAEAKEFKVLTAMDVLGARYDKPQTIDTIRQWASEAGLEMVDIKLGFNGINALMRKPATTA